MEKESPPDVRRDLSLIRWIKPPLRNHVFAGVGGPSRVHPNLHWREAVAAPVPLFTHCIFSFRGIPRRLCTGLGKAPRYQ